jgi:transaldolase
MSRLEDLYYKGGQSPWLDNLRRSWIHDGELARLVAQGVRGITSNPTIFQKAIESSDDYDDQFAELVAAGRTTEDSYWELVVTDIEDALAVLRPVYESSDGGDGYVSVEVAPSLARDLEGTVAAAEELHRRIDAPNLFVKVPATVAGVGAIRRLISAGHSINVTLIFGLERYDEVIEAYISGLEAYLDARGGEADLSGIASVASFFVSRVDTEVDRRLEAVGGGEAPSLRGKAAVAQAQLAYQLFRQRFSGPRWQRLADHGARLQRPLWASTSTKNPAYPDTLYVDQLVGPDTVNTMPEATLAAFEDHGELDRSIDADPEAAQAVMDDLARVGVDLAEVSTILEDQGVAAFAKSFDELIAALDAKGAGGSSPGGTLGDGRTRRAS